MRAPPASRPPAFSSRRQRDPRRLAGEAGRPFGDSLRGLEGWRTDVLAGGDGRGRSAERRSRLARRSRSDTTAACTWCGSTAGTPARWRTAHGHVHGRTGASGGAGEAERRTAPGHLPRVVEGWRCARRSIWSRPTSASAARRRRHVRRKRLRRVASHLSREPARHRRRRARRTTARRSATPSASARTAGRSTRVPTTARRWSPTGTAGSTSCGRRSLPGETPRKGIFYSTLARTPLRRAFGSIPVSRSGASADCRRRAHEYSCRVGRARWRRPPHRVQDDRRQGAAAARRSLPARASAYPVVAGNEGFWIVLWTVQGADGRSVIEGRRIASREP